MTKISTTTETQKRQISTAYPTSMKSLRTSYIEQKNILKTSLDQLNTLLEKFEEYDYINLPNSGRYTHFIRQRYMSDETMKSLKDGAILAPQLLQDDATLKSIFNQASENDIIDFKAVITDGVDLDKELTKLINELDITYPEQTEGAKETPEKLFYESCIDKILGNVRESLKKVEFGETKAWNYEGGDSVAKANSTIPYMQYLGLSIEINEINKAITSKEYLKANEKLNNAKSEIEEMKKANDVTEVPIYQARRLQEYSLQLNTLEQIITSARTSYSFKSIASVSLGSFALGATIGFCLLKNQHRGN
ncbi:hypothetical protein DID73_02450 [Candidatus Marinamargulisbacteria bacterium SCGC AG-343-K17]|nr:hypothetical protein DID73_02450 [Candidatus Marinamargulisbacteria bacterium SCGC AG-343-K17]